MATLFRPGKISPLEVEVRDDLDALQELVGGYIEFVYFDDGSAMMVNEEGRLRGLPPNEAATGIAVLKGHPEVLVGPAVFISKAEMEKIS